MNQKETREVLETFEEVESNELFYASDRYEKPKNVIKGGVVYPFLWRGKVYPGWRRVV